MNKIFILISLISFNLHATEIGNTQFGRIVEIKGEGFISYNGKTKEIRKGDLIESGSDIVIEHKGQVTFTDNADHRFHMGNSSSANVKSKTVELRGGDLWFQSLNKNDNYKIQTANATVDYQGGEGIVTYDSSNGKTQLMVINGMMNLANLRTPELNLSVAEGLFSFVDNTYDEGAPREPTPVGEKTYVQLVALFSGISPMDKKSAEIFKDNHKDNQHESQKASRAIASVAEKAEPVKKGASDSESKLIEEYKSQILDKKEIKKSSVVHVKKTKVEKKITSVEKTVIHIYGLTKVNTIKTRAPASVVEQDVPKDESHTANPYNKDFKKQNKESDKLIEDLNKL